MKDWLLKNKDGITTGLGVAQGAVVAAYQAYEMNAGKPGNGLLIAQSVVFFILSWFVGKRGGTQ